MKKQSFKKKDFSYYLFNVIRYPVKWYLNSKLKIKVTQNDAKDDFGPYFLIGNHSWFSWQAELYNFPM